MYRGHTTAVVVPAYNEEPFVADTIASVPGFVDRVYVVDDGSTDGTWDEIRRAAASADQRPEATEFAERVVPIQHDANRGVGGAIKTGYLRARTDRIELTAVMGADGQMEPEMLGDLFDPIVEGRADYTKGNRFLGATDRGDMPAHRFVGNAALAALTKVASGYWSAGDPQSGYTAISLRALEAADIDGMYEFYGYCNDLLVKLNVAEMRVVDVPRPITYGEEESHIRYRSYVPRVSAMLARNFGWRLGRKYLVYDFHPLVGAYAAGAVASTAGALGLLWALPGVGSFATPVARGAIALAFLLLGALAFVAAMTMDMHANAHLSDSDDPYGRDAQRARGNRDTDAVQVELPAAEWSSLLDDASPNGDAPEAARRLRERLRDRVAEPDRAD
ncbi:glycosyltransferase family 2 protein [Halobacterium litoreum]|uniref:Glycosyltransferase family 2 protein n=1 Tax=Halobacterium litoreum TaxID=2039234 RepID=A0ABD5NAV4_9EURY